jgi:hypothetical protein
MNNEDKVFPWSSQATDTIENLHAQLKANDNNISLQKLRVIQLKLRKETDSIAYKLTKVPIVKKMT